MFIAGLKGLTEPTQYPRDSKLSSGQHYQHLEQAGPLKQKNSNDINFIHTYYSLHLFVFIKEIVVHL